MERITRDRRSFSTFVQSVIEQEGGGPGFVSRFEHYLRNDLFERWLSMRDFAIEVQQKIALGS